MDNEQVDLYTRDNGRGVLMALPDTNHLRIIHDAVANWEAPNATSEQDANAIVKAIEEWLTE